MAAVATEAAIHAVVAGAAGAAYGAATGVGAVATGSAAGVTAAALRAVDEARDNEACNTDNWSEWHEAPDTGGPSP